MMFGWMRWCGSRTVRRSANSVQDAPPARLRRDDLRRAVLRTITRPLDAFRGTGVLMIRRTAATRSELSPRISAISSGVGTGLLMT